MKPFLPVICGLLLVWQPGAAPAQSAGLECHDQMAECLLRHSLDLAASEEGASSRDEAYFAIVAALATMDRSDAALQVTTKIASSRTLAEALGEISNAAARQGQFDKAHRIALDIVDARVKSAQIAALETLAMELAAVGQIDRAFETVVAIDNPYRRSEAQAAIAVSVARSGDIRSAIRTSSRIATDYWFKSDQNKLKVASGLVSRSGDFDNYWFFEALVAIAVLQAQSGDIRGALQTAKSIPDLGSRSRATAQIAVEQAKAGTPEAALITASRVEAAYGDGDAMTAIAEALAATGDFDGALDMARTLAQAYGNPDALVAVALQQALQGQAEAGLATAQSIDNLGSREQGFVAIAGALFDSGQVDEALTILPRIADAGDRFAVIQSAVVRLAQQGEDAQALDIATRFSDPRDMDEAVVAIALEQAKAGRITTAIATAQGLGDAMYRAIALAGIAPFALDIR
jgi:tetratricopeptide (TPR) repeat protein